MATMDKIYGSLLQEDREWFKQEFDPQQKELFALLKDRSLVEGVPETVEREVPDLDMGFKQVLWNNKN